MSLLKTTSRWLYRHFISFLAIVLVLVVARYVLLKMDELISVKAELTRLEHVEHDLAQFMNAMEAAANQRVHELGRESTDAIRKRMASLDGEIRQKQSGPHFRTISPLDILKSTGITEAFKTKVELEILRQERAHLEVLLNFIEGTHNLRLGREELERLRQVHVDAYERLMENQRAQEALRKAYWVKSKIPWTEASVRLDALKDEHTTLLSRNQSAFDGYQRQQKLLGFILRITPKEISTFKVAHEHVVKTIQPLHEAIGTLDQKRQDNLVDKFGGQVFSVIPTALLILISLILLPLAIKAFLYFIVAPLASRRPSICLMPQASGIIACEGENPDDKNTRPRISSVSQAVTVDKSHELLVHSEYLQSTSRKGEKDTKFLLDWAYPFSSLASGMVALTRIRATSNELFVISSTTDPFSEISVISIPEHSAVVLQPHSLVGVIQRRDRPITITRKWRIWSLHAWLTLQFRYLVFHGPAKLIVKGCRGVRVEQADNGRHINQAATIGFSANLAYSTTRCETFTSYLMGKQELFNDNFSGGAGFYIYEEMPHFGQKSGLFGRGLEGITDSILKAFGI